MANDPTKQKQQARDLIDRLPPTQLSAVVVLLEAMLDPVSHAISQAPIDDEALIPEAERALDDAREWSTQNQAIPHEQVLAELGISKKEVKHFKEPT
jgi:hypothetical protein